MNKLITTIAIAGALTLGATIQIAQDVAPVPEPEKVKPAANNKTRRAEGEQLLGTMKNQARVSYSKTASAPKTLTGEVDAGGCRVDEAELVGEYCKVYDKVYEVEGKPESAALIAEDFEGGDGFAIMKFNWAGGDSKISWYKTLDALAKGHEDVIVKDKSTSSGSGDTAEAEELVDPYALWKKEGRNWTHEMTGGMTMKTTIKKVADDHAVQEIQMYFADGSAIGDPTETKIEFMTAEVPEGEEAEDAPKPLEKKIECKAGTFDCLSYDGGKWWVHKKYPGLIVKGESMELVEFNENPKSDDGTEAKPDKPAEDEGAAKPADMSDYWERYVSTFKKGRTWTYEMMGGIQVKNEVTEVTETKATVKTTTLMGGNALGEPSENEYDLTKPEDEGNPDDSIEWVEKEIECKAGTFLCVSPGHGVWMMKKYPMIVVKSDAGMELAEFNE